MKHVPSSTTAPFPQDRTADADDRDIGDHELAVLRAIRDTAFGAVEVTVHQSRVVQITRSEKLRL
jgi:hypothetical protein